jgi:transposase-like protein
MLSSKYVSYKDIKKLPVDLRKIYTSASETIALEELDRFEAEWGKKYPLVVRSWRNNWAELSTFFKYPPEIRKIIYTTNIIESYHRQLRKVTKGKAIFPSDDALAKMLYLVTQDVMRKWTGRIPNWGQLLPQFCVFFPDRLEGYLN